MKDMLGAIVRKLVELPVERLGVLYDFLEKYKKLFEDGEWGDEFKKFLRREKCWTDVVVETLLDFVNTVAIAARTERFIAKDHFVKDTSKKAKGKIYDLGDNFKKNFLSKVEEAIVGTTLSYHKLKKLSRSIPIINELGGDDKAETTLSEMFYLMEKQGDGQGGALLTNGYANIFFIRDVNGVLWTVSCYWRGGGWRVGADSLGGSYEWNDAYQVFSRNSEPSEFSEA